MKKCLHCGELNPNDFKACKSCGRLLEEKDDRIIKKENIKLFYLCIAAVIVFSLFCCFIYDKTAYQNSKISDNELNSEVAKFKTPRKWIVLGKVFYNPSSIPNLLTFFVAAANPKENAEIQYFSTQFETSGNLIYAKKEYKEKVNSEKYFENIVKKLSPSAKNIKLEETIIPSKYEGQKAKDDEDFFKILYENINPGTSKCISWLENFSIMPVCYIFSFEENGNKYYQILEGRFVFFHQYFMDNFSERLIAIIKYIKCDGIFSYKAPEAYFKKNMHKYKTFKKNLKINPQWIEYSYAERRKLLNTSDYLTTESAVRGNRVNIEALKNTIYTIEFLDKNSIAKIKDFSL